MKNLFEFKYLKGKKLEDSIDENLERFKIRTVEKKTKEKLDDNFDVIQEKKEKAKPQWLLIAEFACLIAAVICFGGFLGALEDVSFQVALHNGMVVLIIGGVSLLAFIILHFVLSFRGKLFEKEVASVVDDGEELAKEANYELEISPIFNEIDVILKYYQINKNNKLQRKDFGLSRCINFPLKLFVENNFLCLADIESVYAFNIDNFVKIEKINKNYSIPMWNKEISFQDDFYKQYKIKLGGNGNLIVKGYYLIQFNDNGESYQFKVPPYDIEHIVAILHLPITERDLKTNKLEKADKI